MRRQIELAFKQLVTAPPEIIRALLSGEISVHRAWLCIGESPEKQIEKFRHYQITSEIRKTIRACLSQHVPAAPSTLPDLGTLLKGLPTLEIGEPGSVNVEVLNVP